MKERKKKRAPFTPAERAARHKKRMDTFGVKRIYFRSSATQRGLIEEVKKRSGCNSNEEVISEALREYGLKYGVTLKQIKEDLECLKSPKST